jgi:ligand-binding sensor domain-containing protein
VQCLEESLTPQPSGYTEESFYVYNSRYVLIAANSGLHVYDFLDVDNPVFLKTYPIPNQATNFLSAIVDKHERLWVTLDQGIYYKDRFLSSSDSSMIEVTNVIANSCNYTDQDSSGTLWFGCDNGLLQIETENQQAVYTSRLYKRSDGLLDDQVSYLYVDRTSGTLWVAGEKGLVKVQYLAQPPLQNPNTSYAYPIPAYNIHPTITFTNLPKDSEIYIYNQGRYLVYHAKRGSVQGGQFLWDKKNKQGQRVRGGVYYYAIRTPSDVKRGKLILAH